MKEGWELKCLGEICSVSTGKSNTEDAKLDGEFAFFDRSKIVKRSDRFLFDCEALIIAGEGQTFFPKYFNGKFDLHQRAYAIYNFNKSVDIQFVHQYFVYSQKYFQDVAVGATAKSLRLRHFHDLQIPLPSLPEQQRIVSIIDKSFEVIDKAIENTQKNLQNAKELFESHLNSVFENDGEGWERKKLGDIASVQYGYTDKSFDEGQFRYIRITDISPDGTLIAEDKKYLSDVNNLDLQDYILEHHDLLMARTGATFAKVLLYENLEPSVFASYLIKIKFKVHVENELYWYFTKTKMYWLQAHHLSSGSAQPQFNGAALKQLEVSYPIDIVKQKELIEEFKELLLKVTELESQYQQKLLDLEELKKSILNKAFAGEL